METRTDGASVSGRSHSLWKTQPRASSGAFYAALARPRDAFECRAWRAVLVLPEGERPHPQCFPTGGLTRGSRRSGWFSADLPVLLLQKLTSSFPRFLLASVCIQQGIASGHVFWQRQEEAFYSSSVCRN